MAAQSRATLPHHCPDRDGDRVNTEVYTCLSLSCSPSLKEKQRGRRRSAGESEKRGGGCVTAVNWRRLSAKHLGEGEREKCKGILCLLQPQRLSARGYKSHFGPRGEEEATYFSCLFTPSVAPSLWRGEICLHWSGL